jgi:hypothetical protein
MPKKNQRHKKISPALGGSTQHSRGAHSVKALLQRSTPALAAIVDQRARQGLWHAWLQARLPAELLARVTGVVERDDALVIFTASASWSVRLRYAAGELESELRREQPALQRIVVRVLPPRSAA